jgi:hypothetical protein
MVLPLRQKWDAVPNACCGDILRATFAAGSKLALRVRSSRSAIHKIEHKLGCGTGNVDLVYFSTLPPSAPLQLRIAGKITPVWQ